MSKLYALLIGIDQYKSTNIPNLIGCAIDVKNIHQLITKLYPVPSNRTVISLLDEQATYQGIINSFKSYYGQVSQEDTILFYFSGHGATEKLDAYFHKYSANLLGETLICHDSRHSAPDLADKEIAVMLYYLSQKCKNIIVILDSCHSGSGTRNNTSSQNHVVKQTYLNKVTRPLHSYLKPWNNTSIEQANKSWYQLNEGIPFSSHCLLSACNKHEQAYATENGSVFTNTLCQILSSHHYTISYADLFIKLRAHILQGENIQNPQFDYFDSFSPYRYFLQREVSSRKNTYSLFRKDAKWFIQQGNIHGVLEEKYASNTLAIYKLQDAPDSKHLQGYAYIEQVYPTCSSLRVDFDFDIECHYKAVFVQRVNAMSVQLSGEEEIKEKVIEDFEKHSFECFSFSNKSSEDSLYTLYCNHFDFTILNNKTDEELTTASPLISLEHISRWEQIRMLSNKYLPSTVDVEFFLVKNGEIYSSSLPIENVYSNQSIDFQLWAKNSTNQDFTISLFYLSRYFEVINLSRYRANNETIEVPTCIKANQSIKIYEDTFSINDTTTLQTLDIFKLIFSTDNLSIDKFLFEQGKLVDQTISIKKQVRDLGSVKTPIVAQDTWFTQKIEVKTMRKSNQITSEHDVSTGLIVIKRHENITATVSLNQFPTKTKSIHYLDPYHFIIKNLNAEMISMVSDKERSVLTLDNVKGEITNKPLEVTLSTSLEDNEYVLPIIINQHAILPIGTHNYQESSEFEIRVDINRLLKSDFQYSKSLKNAIKVYFLKISGLYSKEAVQQLRWVNYELDGDKRVVQGIGEKITTAKNVLLLIHGIIGSTSTMVHAFENMELKKKYDLILTFDYENLNTPLEETAIDLKQQLVDFGFGQSDKKQVTILAHSMGGLIARYMIEKLDTSNWINKLIMVGTPNGGSNISSINTNISFYSFWLGILLNSFKLISSAPFFVIQLLSSLKGFQEKTNNVLQTLTQLSPTSNFIRILNSIEDTPPYTVIHGDFEYYINSSHKEGFFIDHLLKQLNDLFYHEPHDMAVSIKSIKSLPNPNKHKFISVNAHHLNYFEASDSLKVLENIL